MQPVSPEVTNFKDYSQTLDFDNFPTQVRPGNATCR